MLITGTLHRKDKLYAIVIESEQEPHGMRILAEVQNVEQARAVIYREVAKKGVDREAD